MGVAAVVVWSGCGGGSGGASCGRTEPCGGSVVGNWKMVDSCIQVTPEMLTDTFCPQGTIRPLSFEPSGNVAFAVNSSYSSALTVSMTLLESLPSSCLTAEGITCADFNSAIQDELATNPDPRFQSYVCAAAGSNCDCTVVLTPMTTAETGTYATAGTVLSTTASDGTTSDDPYCVQGKTLRIIDNEMTMDMGSVTGELVFQLQ